MMAKHDHRHTTHAVSLDDTIAIAQANPDASSSSSTSERCIKKCALQSRTHTSACRLVDQPTARSSWTLHIFSTLLLLALLPTPVLAIFDPGSPTGSTASSSRPTARSIFGTQPLPSTNDKSLISALGPPVSLPRGCRRTNNFLGDVCQNPWAPMQGPGAGVTAELVICSVSDVEPLLEGTRQKRDRVFAISGTITFPEDSDTISNDPYQALLSSEASNAEGARIDPSAERSVEGEGDGFWRQIDGKQEWQRSQPDSSQHLAEPAAAAAAAAAATAAANGSTPPPPSSSQAQAQQSQPPPHEHKAYTDWTASIGGESADTFLSFTEWKERHLAAEKEREREEHERARAAKKSKTTGEQASAGSQTATEASSGVQYAKNQTQATTNGSTSSDTAILDPLAPPGDKDASADVPAVPAKAKAAVTAQEPTYDSIPALSDAAEYLATLKHRWNFASTDCAAGIHRANPSAKFASAILSEKKDRYMLSPCPSRGGRGEAQFVIVELCDEISIDTVVLANYEFFSRVFKRFRISVTRNLQGKADDWHEIGTFRARNARGPQVFKTPQPRSDARFFRYIRIDFLEHYGSEFYCPLSLLRVYGLTQMEDYVREEEELRKAKELEKRRLEEGEPDGEGDAKSETQSQQAAVPVEAPVPVADAGKTDPNHDQRSEPPAARSTAHNASALPMQTSTPPQATAFANASVATLPSQPSTMTIPASGNPSTGQPDPLASMSMPSAPAVLGSTTLPTEPAPSQTSGSSQPPEVGTVTSTVAGYDHKGGAPLSNDLYKPPSESGLNGALERPNLNPQVGFHGGEKTSNQQSVASPSSALPSKSRMAEMTPQSAASVPTQAATTSSTLTSVLVGSWVPTHPAAQKASENPIVGSSSSPLAALVSTMTSGEPGTEKKDVVTSAPPSVAAPLLVTSVHADAARQSSSASSASLIQSQNSSKPVHSTPSTDESRNTTSSAVINNNASRNTSSALPSTSSTASGSIPVTPDSTPRSSNTGGSSGGGGAESIYRTITKRLNALEANATLSLQYMEHSSGQLREVFGRMERRAEERMGEMLRVLNESNWRQIEALKRRQHVDLQRAVFEFDLHRQQVDTERSAVLNQVRLLSSEIVSEKRVGVVQLLLLLCLFVFMALTRSSRASESTSPLLRSKLRLPHVLRSRRNSQVGTQAPALKSPAPVEASSKTIHTKQRPRGNSIASAAGNGTNALALSPNIPRTPRGTTPGSARYRRAPMSSSGRSRAGLLLAGIPTRQGSPRRSSGRKAQLEISNSRHDNEGRPDRSTLSRHNDSHLMSDGYPGSLRSYLEYQLSSPSGKMSSSSLSGSGSGSVGMPLPDSRSADELRAFLKTPPNEVLARDRWGAEHRRKASSPLYYDEPPSLYQRRRSTVPEDGNTTESVSSWTDRSDSESDAGLEENRKLPNGHANDDDDDEAVRVEAPQDRRQSLGMERTDTIRNPMPSFSVSPKLSLSHLHDNEVQVMSPQEDEGYERDEGADAEEVATVNQSTWKGKRPNGIADADLPQTPMASSGLREDDDQAPWQEVRPRRAGSVRSRVRSHDGTESPRLCVTPDRRGASSSGEPLSSPITPRTSSPVPSIGQGNGGSGAGGWSKLLRRGGSTSSTGKSTPTGPPGSAGMDGTRPGPLHVTVFGSPSRNQTNQQHQRVQSMGDRPSSPLRPASPAVMTASPLRPASPRFALAAHLRGNTPVMASPTHSNGSSPSPSPPRSPVPSMFRRKGHKE